VQQGDGDGDSVLGLNKRGNAMLGERASAKGSPKPPVKHAAESVVPGTA